VHFAEGPFGACFREGFVLRFVLRWGEWSREELSYVQTSQLWEIEQVCQEAYRFEAV